MKTKKIFLPLLVVLAAFLFSCESEETDIQENNIESTNISDLIISADQLEFDIATSERFRYDLNLADNEEATIISGAENAIVDKINANGKYVYLSDADFTGTEGILIRIEAEPTEEQEGLILIFGNVRYVYITLNVGESLDDLIAIAIPKEVTVTSGDDTFILAPWNDEEEVEIIIEPENGQLGGFTFTPDMGFMYQSDEGFTGTDNVLVKYTDYFLPNNDGEYPTRYVYYTINVEAPLVGIIFN